MCVICGCPSCTAIVSAQVADGAPTVEEQADQGFLLFNNKWGEDALGTPSGEITWNANLAGLMIGAFSGFTLAEFEQALQDAFDAWEAVAQVTFRQVSDPADADVDISFTDQDVGAFDLGEPGGTLAVASSFVTSGPVDNNLSVMLPSTIHFDSAENWAPSGGSRFQVDFFAVALHEIGHIIGLDHHDTSIQIMNSEISTGELQDGDIAGARLIYGARVTGTDSAEVMSLAEDTPGAEFFAGGGNDQVTGTLGDDLVTGGTGNDDIFGRDGDDFLVDTSGSNDVSGGADDDTIIGGRGTLRAEGDGGLDVLIGGIGNDTLDGGAGNDIIRGDPKNSFLAGNDTIIAGAGNDFLEGGGGADVFVFNQNEDTNRIGQLDISGTNVSVIGRDFEVGVDRIDLSDFGFANFAAVGNAMTTSGANTEFVASGTTIVIFGVTEDAFSADDFILV
ncbi:MAG: matrixin family metalloprotease [Pseudomonadota bacterium]